MYCSTQHWAVFIDSEIVEFYFDRQYDYLKAIKGNW